LDGPVTARVELNCFGLLARGACCILVAACAEDDRAYRECVQEPSSSCECMFDSDCALSGCSATATGWSNPCDSDCVLGWPVTEATLTLQGGEKCRFYSGAIATCASLDCSGYALLEPACREGKCVGYALANLPLP